MTDFLLPQVRVVVLNWNSAWYSTRCLRALERTDYPPDRLDVVLVDNGSIDSSLVQLRRSFPDLHVIENGQNLGFAEGCNRALRDPGDAELIALVNNDAVVEPGWLRPLVDVIESDPSAGAAAAKLLLEPSFAAIEVDLVGSANGSAPTAGQWLEAVHEAQDVPEVRRGGQARKSGEKRRRTTDAVDIVAVEVDGLDVTDRLRHDGLTIEHDLAWPLLVTRRIAGPATVWVPARPGAERITLGSPARASFRSAPAGSGQQQSITTPGELTIDAPTGRTTLVNGLGTAMTDEAEGFDRYFAQPDSDDLEGGAVRGFSGGGVLLRREMLEEIGLLDPAYFAYYEDTDLAWRARRGGWGTVAVPESVIHHAYGASGGHRAKGFFYLDRRNWMLTAFRNGDQDIARTVRMKARYETRKAFRQNVFGQAPPAAASRASSCWSPGSASGSP